MPSVSEKQANVMRARAHGAKLDDPKLNRIPRSVAREFVEADKKRSVKEKLEQIRRHAPRYKKESQRERVKKKAYLLGTVRG